jgi:hypothetical protein
MAAVLQGGTGSMIAPPEDDLARSLEIARPEDPDLVHLAVVGTPTPCCSLVSRRPGASRCWTC